MDEDSGFDYLFYDTCRFGVADTSRAEGISDCGKPAIGNVWWGSGKPMPLCLKHMKKVAKSEKIIIF